MCVDGEGACLFCWGSISEGSRRGEGIARSEDEFGYEQWGNGGEVWVFNRTNWLEQMAKKNLKPLVIVPTKRWCDEISVSHLSYSLWKADWGFPAQICDS